MIVIHENKKIKLDTHKMYSIEDRYICTPLEMHTLSEAGLIMPEKTKQELVPAIIKSKGNKCEPQYGQPGDVIFIRPTAGTWFNGADGKKDLLVVRQTEIISILEQKDFETIENNTMDEHVKTVREADILGLHGDNKTEEHE